MQIGIFDCELNAVLRQVMDYVLKASIGNMQTTRQRPRDQPVCISRTVPESSISKSCQSICNEDPD